MKTQITQFERYGKQPIHKRMFHEIKDRFKVNKYSTRILNTHGLDSYVPKLNKTRFTIGMIAAVICIITPVITILSIPAVLWSLK